MTKDWLSAVTRGAVLGSLVCLMVLRMYAAWYRVPVCTWDDSMHREQAVGTTISLRQAVRLLTLPTTYNIVLDKTMGYYLWLVMGHHLFSGLGTQSQCSNSTTERAWQLINILLLLIQFGCVYGLAAWAFDDRTLGLAAVALYFLSPIVFGMNRWVMTENHVMAAFWVGSAAAVIALRRGSVWVYVPCALAIGSFSTTREYALPFMTAIALGAILALGVTHGARAVLFAALVVPYYVCAAIAARSSYDIAMAKFLNPAGQAGLHFPLVQWVPHVVMESIGPVLSAGLTGVAMFLMVRALKAPRFRDGLFVFWLVLGLVTAGTLLACVITIQRIARSSIPPYVLGFAFVLIGVKATRVTLTPRWRRFIYGCVLVGLVISWGFMIDHLFVRFDAGGSYRHRAGQMEYYNHPFWLRPLRDRSDRHFE